MNTDLGALKNAVVEYLAAQQMIAFHSYMRHHEGVPAIGWDSKRYPDFRAFIDTAKRAGIEMVVIRTEHFSEDDIEETLSELGEADLEKSDQRRIERRLGELRGYVGFASNIELSYDYQGRLYFFDLRTDWYDEYLDLHDEIITLLPDPSESGDDGPVGGYYSRN
jgi:hypothetical protein